MILALPILLLCLSGMPETLDGTPVELDDTDAKLPNGVLRRLLDHASQWEGDLEPGSTVPDYDAIRSDPAAARGERFLLEGTLETLGPPHLFESSTDPYDGIRPWHVRTERGGVVIVYLTDPPALEVRREEQDHQITAQRGRSVRVVARFFKLVRQTSVGGDAQSYPVFVGRSAEFGGKPGPAGGWGTVTPVVVLLVVLLFGAYFVIRLALSRSGRRAYANRGSGGSGEVVDNRTDLPDDPAKALDALEHEKQAARAQIVNPLDAAAEQHRDHD